MTDPVNPDVPPPPAYNAPPAASQPAYAQSGYPTAPPAPYGEPGANATIPGKTMGIIAFILSFFVQLIALILGIVALVQSRKAGYKNGWALAAIIISSVLIVLGIIFSVIFIALILPGLAGVAEEVVRQCQELGSGIHEINGISVDCSEVLGNR